jgi:hypothetical protein
MEIVLGAVVAVIAFLIGQYVLRMVLEPVARLRRTTAQISLCILSNQRKLSNCRRDETLAAELQKLAGELVSGTNEILHYDLALRFRLAGRFKRKEALEAARELNGIASNFSQDESPNASMENIKSAAKIEKLLRVQTSYSGKF